MNEKAVKQQRDLKFEKQQVESLKKLIPSFQWLTQINKNKTQTFEYLTGVQLFQVNPSTNTDKDAALLLERMLEITGQEFQSVFLGMCKKGEKYFDTKTGE